MTPLLPRAPISAPLAIAWATSEVFVSVGRAASAIVERIVSSILVPVSPSGTGKTFRALITVAFLSNQRVAAQNISRSSRPLQEDLGLTPFNAVVIFPP